MLRHLILLIAILSLIILPAVASTGPENQGEGMDSRLEKLLETDFSYDVGFLWMDQVAIGSFRFQESNMPGIYIASLEGKTTGFAGWLTRNRIQRYVTLMRLRDDGSFITVRHSSQIEKGSGSSYKKRTKVFEFDYDTRTVTASKRGNNDELFYEKQIELEGDPPPTDILTAYYNFVIGHYGPVEVGRHYEVPAFSDDGTGMITIDVLRPEERPDISLFPDDGLLVKVQVEQEIFDTDDGILYAWFNDRLHPERGVIKGIIGIGDIRGIIRR